MRLNHHIRTTAALALALSAVAAPAASAQPKLNPPDPMAPPSQTSSAVLANPDQQTALAAYTRRCSEVCSGGGYGAASGQVGPPILRVPTPAQRAAINRAQPQEAQRLANHPQAGSKYSTAELNAYATNRSPNALATVVRVSTSQGFDWGDAG